MKSCPECGTEFEDHVPTCLVDGTPLGDVAPTIPPAQTAPAEEEDDKKGGGMLLPVLLVVGLLLLLGVGAVAYVLTSTGEPEPAPVVEAPKPAEPAVLAVGFTSEPDGAKVTEGGEPICTTPCTVPHMEGVPLPRTFVLSAEGYADAEHLMNNPGIPQHVRLKSLTPEPAPAPVPAPARPRPVRPKPKPVVGGPAIIDER